MAAVIVHGVKIKYHIPKSEIYEVYVCMYVCIYIYIYIYIYGTDLSASSCEK